MGTVRRISSSAGEEAVLEGGAEACPAYPDGSGIRRSLSSPSSMLASRGQSERPVDDREDRELASLLDDVYQADLKALQSPRVVDKTEL